jgi:O-antigen/teichoic acid export membrane protein
LLRKHKAKFVDGGWVVSANLFRQLLSLVFLMVLVRYFSREDVGRFQLVVAAVGFGGITTLPGIGDAVIQSVARGYPGTFRRTMKLRFAMSVLGAAGLAVYALLQPHASALRLALLTAAALFPFSQGLAGWTDFQSGESKFKANSLWTAAAQIVSYGGMIVALLLASPTITWLVAIMYAALAVLNITALATILPRIPKHAQPEPGAVRYGLETSVYNAIDVAGNYIDKFLLFYLLSPASLAIFVIAERIPELFKNYIKTARAVLVPGFSRKKAYTADLDRKITLLSMATSAAIAFIALLIIPWFLPLAFTDAYAETVLYSQLLCGTLVIGQISQTKKTFLVSRLDAAALRHITLGGNVVRIIASLVLVPLFGIMGAVISTAIYRLATAIIVTRVMRRYRLAADAS